MIDRALIGLMTDTISWSTSGATSQYGVPTWSTSGTTMRARIVIKHGEVRDRGGAVREAQGHLWCVQDSTHTNGQTMTPTPDDRVTLPDGSSPPVLLVETYPDDSGLHHHKVTFGY